MGGRIEENNAAKISFQNFMNPFLTGKVYKAGQQDLTSSKKSLQKQKCKL